jgi:fused signal recognition particle receptor
VIVETPKMFSFFRKKAPEVVPLAPASSIAAPASSTTEPASPVTAPAATPTGPLAEPPSMPIGLEVQNVPVGLSPSPVPPKPAVVPAAEPVSLAPGAAQIAAQAPNVPVAPALQEAAPAAAAAGASRLGWLTKLKNGLRRTGNSIATVFTGTQIDDALYEELESALLMSDAGVAATAHLLADLKRRVKDSKATNPSVVKALLADAFTELLLPLQKPLTIGEFKPTVMMIAGVNGAGKTTSIGKLTKHLADSGASVLLAAADTFRAAAREQLTVWADRNTVDIISQEGGDPAAVSFDAVSAGKARGRDVVMVDTAGRLPTQLHLMEEIKKIKRVIQKTGPVHSLGTAGPPQGDWAPTGGSAAHEVANVGAVPPHEVLLVLDGNTGQNALAQVKAFDEALQVTGLIITKLDGTAKGGVIAAIALWARERAAKQPALRPISIYFIGVGEKLEDLETFSAREFSQALLQ